jgi:Flp pilus assembly pilin Flp
MHTEAHFLYPMRTVNAFRHLLRRLRLPTRDERGAVAAEYALVLGLIALVIVVGATLFGLSLLGLFERGPTAFPS